MDACVIDQAQVKIGCCTTEIALTRCADFPDRSPSTAQFSVHLRKPVLLFQLAA